MSAVGVTSISVRIQDSDEAPQEDGRKYLTVSASGGDGDDGSGR